MIFILFLTDSSNVIVMQQSIAGNSVDVSVVYVRAGHNQYPDRTCATVRCICMDARMNV